MLSSHQLFQRAPEALVEQILLYMRKEEREVYKSALATLASGRRLRPVFIQKRPLDKQLLWIADSLKLRTGDAVAEQLLQVWLLKANKEMLIAFLDKMGIGHDGEGSVDELPEELDAEKLGEAIDFLLADYPPDAVKIYLHLFRSQRPGGWESLATLLAEDERLAL